MTTGSQRVGKISAASGQFLEWLDGGIHSGCQRYLEMHHRLVAYFDRKNCSSPADLADETLNRVARLLEEEGVTYCVVLNAN